MSQKIKILMLINCIFYIDKNTQKHVTDLQIKRKNKTRYF